VEGEGEREDENNVSFPSLHCTPEQEVDTQERRGQTKNLPITAMRPLTPFQLKGTENTAATKSSLKLRKS
jgi:hypothetical protein